MGAETVGRTVQDTEPSTPVHTKATPEEDQNTMLTPPRHLVWYIDSPSVLPSPPRTVVSEEEEEVSKERVLDIVPTSDVDRQDRELQEPIARESATSQLATLANASTLHSLSLKEWRRLSPVYNNFEEALDDLGYTLLPTPSYKNCCLLFSFLLCSNGKSTIEDHARCVQP